ncbi:manganese efflux pump [Sphingomonas sp. 1P06PA]|uniref:manganese efflux pump MntP n=1 Tax=Sphingomonas sp. 1P06PA TaxID=554121 RepID=UPI0039A42B99
MLTFLILSLALAMDAFAVAIVQGASVRCGAAGAARLGLAFGAAQAAMAGLGWALGAFAAGWIASVDHWIAFGLLGILGLRMIREGFSPADDAAPALLGGTALLAAALATSIDAAAAGVTLPLIGLPAAVSLSAIGIVTALLSFGGTLFGARLGAAFGKRAEIAGGLVLVGLGIKILIEHLAS